MAINKYKLIKDQEVNVSNFIYKAVDRKELEFDVVVSESGKRLDHYAQEYYEDAGNWWLIAAASGIGWWLQVPEGVVLKIPSDLEEVEDFIESIE